MGDEGEQSISLLQVPPLCKTGVHSGIVMVDDDLIHLSVWVSPSALTLMFAHITLN